jgi:hypothetical protein
MRNPAAKSIGWAVRNTICTDYVTTHLRYQRTQHGPEGVAQHAHPAGAAGDELIASDEEHDRRPSRDYKAVVPAGCGEAKQGRRDLEAGTADNLALHGILACAPDVGTRRAGSHEECASADLDVLGADHLSCVRRHRGARRDLDRLAGAERAVPQASWPDMPSYQPVRRGTSNCVAVHCGGVKCWKRRARLYILAKHIPERIR